MENKHLIVVKKETYLKLRARREKLVKTKTERTPTFDDAIVDLLTEVEKKNARN